MNHPVFLANWHSHTFRCKHAAGDVAEPALRQVATAVAGGAVAATSAIRFLNANPLPSDGVPA